MKLKRAFHLSVLIAALIGAPISVGIEPGPADVEAIARKLEGNLIAPCCWSQTIAEHRSEAAEKIRQQIRDMIQKGRSHQQILDFFVSEYGERILAAPRPKGFNLAAYILPGLALLAGASVVAAVIRRWKSSPAAPPGPPGQGDSDYLTRIEREVGDSE